MAVAVAVVVAVAVAVLVLVVVAVLVFVFVFACPGPRVWLEYRGTLRDVFSSPPLSGGLRNEFVWELRKPPKSTRFQRVPFFSR